MHRWHKLLFFSFPNTIPQVFALAALISAAVVLGVIDEENFRLLGDVVDSTEGAAGWVICLAGFTMAAEIGFIALLCLRAFGIVTLDSEMFIFLVVRVVVSYDCIMVPSHGVICINEAKNLIF